MANLDRYVREAEVLLNGMGVEYNSISVQRYDSIQALKSKQEGFQQFEKSMLNERFKVAFGWRIARWNPYIFMIKITKKQVFYIEIEMKY